MFWDSRDISKMAPFTGLFPGNAVHGNHVREKSPIVRNARPWITNDKSARIHELSGGGSTGTCSEPAGVDVFPEEAVNRLSSRYVIRSPLALSCSTRSGAFARGTSSSLRPDLAVGRGDLGEPPADR